MSKLDERIAMTEQRLKTLKARQVRAAMKQRGRDAKQRRRDEVRRKILVGAVVLGLVERGEIETSLLKKWLAGALTRDEDRKLFSECWDSPSELPPGPSLASESIPRIASSKVESGKNARETRASG